MFFNLKDLNLEEIKSEIEKDRQLVKDILEGKVKQRGVTDIIKTILFIVESPNKARTIANFFGRPSSRKFGKITAYEVSLGDKHLIIVATKGHIVDLTTEERGLYGVEQRNGLFVPVYSPIKKCLDCGYQFTEYVEGKKCPACGSTNIDDAVERINALRELASEAEIVLIGTDPDAEGEFIAYSTYLVIKPFAKKIYRAEFHEVTKSAILRAIEELREINLDRVRAQIVRRIEDRWLGFSLSSKVQKVFKREYLSAGRVQTPVLGWIIDRYLEHKNSIVYFIGVKAGDLNLIVDLDIKKRKEAIEIANKLRSSRVKVSILDVFEREINPLPPYMTSTMLQDAVNYLGLSVDRIMQLAQNLFEAGLITYHRTDSIRVSSAGIQVAKEFITQSFGEEYFKPRTWGEGGAHECIRPTKPISPDMLVNMISNGELEVFVELTKNHIALYSLIFRRFMQSQMIPVVAKFAKQVIEIPEINYKEEKEGVLEVLRHGWDLVDDYRIKNLMIQAISGEIPIEHVSFWRSAKIRLYSQSDVINLMRERKIGRPSTYATIVSKLIKRGYVMDVNRKLIPTKLGVYVYSFLKKKYGDYVSEERTRKLEEKMDLIEEGKLDYQEVLRNLYSETEKILEQEDSPEEAEEIIIEADKKFGFNKRKYKKKFKK